MLIQLSIPLYLQSLPGTILYITLIPLWIIIVKIEEKELLEYWGERYKRYMEKTPMLIPIPRLRRSK